MRILKCSLTVLVLLGISVSLSCCKEIGTANDTSANTIPPYSEVSLSFEEETTSAKREWNGYEYVIFNDSKEKLTVYLPIVIEDYIVEYDNGTKCYMLKQLIEDNGWEAMDADENGDIILPINELGDLSYDSLKTEGDYFYYDCGDFWVRFLIQNRIYDKTSLMLVPEFIDYSFILPNKPGTNYYEFHSDKSHPNNSVYAHIFSIYSSNNDLHMTDLDDTYVTYDQFVLLAYMFSWIKIDPEENPLYYLDFGEMRAQESVQQDIMRDQYILDGSL